MQGDATQMHSLRMPLDWFDHAISLLVNLHVPDRQALLTGMFTRLKPGGTFCIEDFAALSPPSPSEAATLVAPTDAAHPCMAAVLPHDHLRR